MTAELLLNLFIQASFIFATMCYGYAIISDLVSIYGEERVLMLIEPIVLLIFNIILAIVIIGGAQLWL